MEIFNAARTQQPQTTTGAAQQTNARSEEVQKTPIQKERENVQEVRDKSETEKLKKDLQEVVEKLNKEMEPLKTTIRFGFDDKVSELYVSVIDTSTNEEIRKIPSDEALRLAAKMRELVGMLFDKKG